MARPGEHVLPVGHELGDRGRPRREMAADAARVREGRPTILTSVRTAPAVTEIAGWVRDEVARHALVAHPAHRE
ncbi:hypothetical protein [Actinomycetospora sp. CA-053990]|uniref:hypothetical protein n=1 Tax=Actinomycetospora sp. CA-053990 TaxID=3239891 RepID=UPI003D8FF45A